MKHVGADNFVLYALCSAATRIESLAKKGLGAGRELVQKVVGSAPKSLADGTDKQAPHVRSAGSDRRLPGA